ncbi:MAG TPA: selenide, water dikinase SelD [Candidatus Sulfotelmatobacter sp.]|nr:selenide, water dikinase SelD [Candidatus Sulfotelmatobacter sp.]
MSPAALDTVLGKLARQHDHNVLVGFDRADDAGVYQIAPDQALVQTVDFFTPVVDDPYTFGQIAATNALSDVYAMGGKPLTSLALVCFPDKADLAILERILAGGLSKMIEAGCTVIGGHSIRDDETKFGYAVTGLVHPRKVLANSGAKPGDALILTKRLGTGVISTAIKKGKAKAAWIDAAVQSMTTLNKIPAELIAGKNHNAHGFNSRYEVHGMTDVTGFGLIGHARELALASNVSLQIFSEKIAALPGALDCIRAGHIPGGLNANRDFAECVVGYEAEISPELKALLFDPQTAGGLLISIAEKNSEELLLELQNAAIPARHIGNVTESQKPLIRIC